MSISPTSRMANSPFVTPANDARTSGKGPAEKSRTTAREGGNSDIKRAQEAEKEAQRRIAEADSRVREYQRGANDEIEHLREEYSNQMDSERARQEEAIISERHEGNERISELKRRQQEELSSVRRDGERLLDDIKRHYRETTYRNFRDSEKSLKEQQTRNTVTQQQDQLQSSNAMEKARLNQELQMTMLKDHHEQQSRDLNQNYRIELDNLREKTAEAKMQAEETFSDSYEKLAKRQQQMVLDLDARTARQLDTLRDANALRLAAYDSRAEDEFYKLRHLNASIDESDDFYIVRATIPEHERKNLSVSVQGSAVTITNQRRSQEESSPEPGRRQSTANYQIVTESFPLAMPVDARAVTREFDGDTFIVTIPKKVTYSAAMPLAGNHGKKGSKQVERMTAERPRFPDNLPVDQTELSRKIAESRLPGSQIRGDSESGALKQSRTKGRGIPGGGTLS